MDNSNVIIRPLVTEKSTRLANTRNSYAFEVAKTATKPQIRQAIEKAYSVKVAEVRTMVRKGKPRRTRYKLLTTPSWKRAVVQLEEGSKIELF